MIRTIRQLADQIAAMPRARERAAMRYGKSDQPAQLSTWPGVIGAHRASLYTKNCREWLGLINLYEWTPAYGTAGSETPSYMPVYRQFDPNGSDHDFFLIPGQFTPEQSWWDYSPVTGMWAINTAEFQYRGDLLRETGPTFVIPGTPVGMWWGLWRDFDLCAHNGERRTNWVVPCFHHYMSPLYQECFQ